MSGTAFILDHAPSALMRFAGWRPAASAHDPSRAQVRQARSSVTSPAADVIEGRLAVRPATKT
jgi:hypothetical protein